MEYRLGTCSDCGARFKVPATFKADRAKCQKCSGVVKIGPIQSEASPAGGRPGSDSGNQPPRVPARKPAPVQAEVPAGPKEPAKKKRSGPSMKARLLAQRKAETEKSPAKPASSSGTRPVARKSARASDSSETRTGSAWTARASSVKGARSEKSSGARSSASGRRATAGSSRRRGSRGDPVKDDDKGPRGGRRDVKSKQKSPAPVIGAAVLALIIGFGAYKFVFQADEQVNAGETEVATAETPDDPMAGSVIEDEPLEDADEGLAEEDTAESEELAIEEVAPKPEKVYDPASVDLTVLADFGPYGSTTEAEWQEMKQLMVTYTDADAGAAGRRAGNSLEEIGKAAIPAIINRFKTMDFSTEQGYRDGDVTQRLLMTICSGTNVGWRYSTEPKENVFNKKAVKLWHEIWDKAKDNEAYWNQIANLGESNAGEAKQSATPEVSDDDLDDLDALGDG